jgi:hypothetical protein
VVSGILVGFELGDAVEEVEADEAPAAQASEAAADADEAAADTDDTKADA